jgi:hypothetical protein
MSADAPDPLPHINGHEAKSAREEVLSRVAHGEMTPIEAEQWATDRGLQPFVTRPASSTFDPMALQRWTPLQAVVWIAYRDVEEVRNVSTEFRQHWTVWRPNTSALALQAIDLARIHRKLDGHVLEKQEQARLEDWHVELARPATFASFLDVDLRVTDGLAPHEDKPLTAAEFGKFEAACDALRQALANAEIQSIGIVAGRSCRSEIPSMAWIDLTFARDAADVAHSDHGLTYTGVRIDRAAIMERWPVITPHQAALDAALLEAAEANGGIITYKQAEDIAKQLGANMPRTALRNMVNDLGIKGTQGRRRNMP